MAHTTVISKALALQGGWGSLAAEMLSALFLLLLQIELLKTSRELGTSQVPVCPHDDHTHSHFMGDSGSECWQGLPMTAHLASKRIEAKGSFGGF